MPVDKAAVLQICLSHWPRQTQDWADVHV